MSAAAFIQLVSVVAQEKSLKKELERVRAEKKKIINNLKSCVPERYRNSTKRQSYDIALRYMFTCKDHIPSEAPLYVESFQYRCERENGCECLGWHYHQWYVDLLHHLENRKTTHYDTLHVWSGLSYNQETTVTCESKKDQWYPFMQEVSRSQGCRIDQCFRPFIRVRRFPMEILLRYITHAVRFSSDDVVCKGVTEGTFCLIYLDNPEIRCYDVNHMRTWPFAERMYKELVFENFRQHQAARVIQRYIREFFERPLYPSGREGFSMRQGWDLVQTKAQARN